MFPEVREYSRSFARQFIRTATVPFLIVELLSFHGKICFLQSVAYKTSFVLITVAMLEAFYMQYKTVEPRLLEILGVFLQTAQTCLGNVREFFQLFGETALVPVWEIHRFVEGNVRPCFMFYFIFKGSLHVLRLTRISHISYITYLVCRVSRISPISYMTYLVYHPSRI